MGSSRQAVLHGNRGGRETRQRQAPQGMTRRWPELRVVRFPDTDSGANVDDWHIFLDDVGGSRNYGKGKARALGSMAIVYVPAKEFGLMLAARRRTTRGRINPDEPDRGKHVVPGLTSELDQISQDYERDPHHLTIICDRVSVLDEPGKDLVLGLLPRDEDVASLILRQQAKTAFGRLASQSKRLAYPASPSTVCIPFARIPGNISGVKYERLMAGLKGHLPHTFVLGGIDYTCKDRSPTE